jgi:hypothetical protein
MGSSKTEHHLIAERHIAEQEGGGSWNRRTADMCSSSLRENSELIALFHNAASSLALLLTLPEDTHSGCAIDILHIPSVVTYSGLNLMIQSTNAFL